MTAKTKPQDIHPEKKENGWNDLPTEVEVPGSRFMATRILLSDYPVSLVFSFVVVIVTQKLFETLIREPVGTSCQRMRTFQEVSYLPSTTISVAPHLPPGLAVPAKRATLRERVSSSPNRRFSPFSCGSPISWPPSGDQHRQPVTGAIKTFKHGESGRSADGGFFYSNRVPFCFSFLFLCPTSLSRWCLVGCSFVTSAPCFYLGERVAGHRHEI